MPTYLLQGRIRELEGGPVDPGYGIEGPMDPNRPGLPIELPPNTTWPIPLPPSPPVAGQPLPRPPFIPVDPDWGVNNPPTIWPPVANAPVGRVWLLIYNRDLGWRYVLLDFPQPAPA